MKRKELFWVSFTAIGVVLVFLATLIHIPLPSFRLYFNLGETTIYVIAIIFGRFTGMIAGAIGSALADIQLGYSVWAPFSLVIKGVEGYLVGTFAARGKDWEKRAVGRGAAFMVLGYSLAAWLLFGWPALLWELPLDLIQCGVGIVLALLVVRYLRSRFSWVNRMKELG
ncbi:MAG: hypothetical protein PWP04_548 [Candidatus Atribacteria bacterium]|nr:hypothetical protein [Candidatus Atribacteria bacterium]